MATRQKARSVRQSVTIPPALASEVRRVAKQRHITMSRALVTLAERGVRAEADAKERLKASLDRFLEEGDPARKNEAGRDLIRSIFGRPRLPKIQFSNLPRGVSLHLLQRVDERSVSLTDLASLQERYTHRTTPTGTRFGAGGCFRIETTQRYTSSAVRIAPYISGKRISDFTRSQ